ncbi:energy-coupling factor transporter transmembrane component T [Latilactobacillus sakei]
MAFLQLITWPAFILALRQLKLPGLLVLTLEISLKYSHLLAQFLQESLWAIRLRSTGKAQKRQHLVGSLIGRLYLSARAYMTELYQAMLLRGYTGHVNQQASLTITRYDWRLISWDLTLICLFCFIRR